MRRFPARMAWVVCCSLVLGCTRDNGSEALAVTVRVDPNAIASCIKVEAVSAGSTPVSTLRMPRADTLEVAIFPGAGLQGAVALTARGYVGAACDDPLILNLESDPVTTAFVRGQVTKVEVPVHSPPPSLDGDGDGYRKADAGGADCNDANAQAYPGAPEICDGIDNDCDGVADEGFALGSGCDAGLGVCMTTGATVCAANHLSTKCSAVPDLSKATSEICDGLDNDCDGIVDNGFNVGGACDAGLGVCQRLGTVVCSGGGASSQCSVTADLSKISREICDGLDNDCNGLVDEPPACGGPDQDVAENVAATWGAQEAGGTPCGPGAANATMTGDPTAPYCQVGAVAARVAYTAGVYFMGVYPQARNGDWDLSTRTGLNFYASGLVPPGYGGWAPAGPSVVLCSPDGGYLRLDPTVNLLPFDGGAPVLLRVPLDGGPGWTLTSVGYDPRTVGWIQLEANPLQNGAPAGTTILWVDDVRFY